MLSSELIAITLVAPSLGIPARSGGSIRTLALANWLARHSRLTLVAPGNGLDTDELPFRVVVVDPITSSLGKVLRRVRASARGAPRGWEWAIHRALEWHAVKALEEGELVILCQLMTLPNIPRDMRSDVWIDSHDLVSVRFARRSLAGKAARSYRHRKATKFEQAALATVDAFLVCSEFERREALRLVPKARVHVVENGTHDLTPHPLPPQGTAYFIGTLDYEPNVEGLRWFLAEIWPRVRASVPDARVLVAGSGDAEWIEHIVDASDGVSLRSNVSNAHAALSGFRVCIVPLLSGSGTRIKVLEAAAMAHPIVATRVGAEGLDLPASLLPATDTPQQFANRLSLLMTSDLEAQSQASALRTWVEPLRWETIFDQRLAPLLEHRMAGRHAFQRNGQRRGRRF